MEQTRTSKRDWIVDGPSAVNGSSGGKSCGMKCICYRGPHVTRLKYKS